LVVALPLRAPSGRVLRRKDGQTSLSDKGEGGGDGSGLAELFPVKVLKEYTTLPGTPNAIELKGTFFRSKDKGADYSDAPDGKHALKAHYAAGSYRLGVKGVPKGGFNFYSPGPDGLDLTTAKEAVFGYSVMFPKGFEFVKGGKLPGFYGGDTEEESVSCSGGRHSSTCFSSRLMWRTDGKGELYTYLPPKYLSTNKIACGTVAHSDCGNEYGDSIGTGLFSFEPGKWTTVSMRVKLNDADKQNGEIEVFVHGKSTIKIDKLGIRQDGKGRIRGIQMQTFFGGHDKGWASPKDQDVYFSDFSLGITEKL